MEIFERYFGNSSFERLLSASFQWNMQILFCPEKIKEKQ